MDGAGDMPQGWGTEFDIDVIPINIHFGDEVFLQGVDISDVEFYRIADESGVIPKTSQPTPHQFIEFYNKIAEIGDTILSLHVTSELSGTFDSAVLATRELNDKFNIFPFDSANGSAGLGYMCKEARLLDKAGASIEAILERMSYLKQNINIVLTLDNLEYARMSGRVRTLQAALASVLQIKPIILLRDGVLDLSERTRTRKRSIDRIVDIVCEGVGNKLVNIAVVQAQAPDIGAELVDRINKMLNCKEIIMTELSIGVAANLGPGTVGIVAYPVEEG
jgi:DegV family protein with EDD domain